MFPVRDADLIMFGEPYVTPRKGGCGGLVGCVNALRPKTLESCHVLISTTESETNPKIEVISGHMVSYKDVSDMTVTLVATWNWWEPVNLNIYRNSSLETIPTVIIRNSYDVCLNQGRMVTFTQGNKIYGKACFSTTIYTELDDLGCSNLCREDCQRFFTSCGRFFNVHHQEPGYEITVFSVDQSPPDVPTGFRHVTLTRVWDCLWEGQVEIQLLVTSGSLVTSAVDFMDSSLKTYRAWDLEEGRMILNQISGEISVLGEAQDKFYIVRCSQDFPSRNVALTICPKGSEDKLFKAVCKFSRSFKAKDDFVVEPIDQELMVLGCTTAEEECVIGIFDMKKIKNDKWQQIEPLRELWTPRARFYSFEDGDFVFWQLDEDKRTRSLIVRGRDSYVSLDQ